MSQFSIFFVSQLITMLLFYLTFWKTFINLHMFDNIRHFLIVCSKLFFIFMLICKQNKFKILNVLHMDMEVCNQIWDGKITKTGYNFIKIYGQRLNCWSVKIYRWRKNPKKTFLNAIDSNSTQLIRNLEWIFLLGKYSILFSPVNMIQIQSSLYIIL